MLLIPARMLTMGPVCCFVYLLVQKQEISSLKDLEVHARASRSSLTDAVRRLVETGDLEEYKPRRRGGGRALRIRFTRSSHEGAAA